jgi:hypothetical protein
MSKAVLRFVQKRIGKDNIMAGFKTDSLHEQIDELYYEMRKIETNETMTDIPRLLHRMHNSKEVKKYWR